LGPKILHVWNTAGVASVIAKFVDRGYGTQSTVITRAAADRVGLTTYGTAYPDGPARFFVRAVSMARGADLVHVHSLDRVVPWIKRLYGKPVVMHYHGTDVEGRWEEKRPRWSRADYIAVSTPNLLEGAPPGRSMFPTPSTRTSSGPVRGQSARLRGLLPLWDGRGRRGSCEEVRALADLAGPLERKARDMPGVLSKYSYYIDMRKPPGRVPARSVGKAALEALACGCSVVDWTGAVIRGLPPENEPASVAARWNEVYSDVLRKGRQAGDTGL